MNEGAIANVNHASAQGTLADVRPVHSLITVSILLWYLPPGCPLRPEVRRMEGARLFACVTVSDFLT
jgi:hypothetical protein